MGDAKDEVVRVIERHRKFGPFYSTELLLQVSPLAGNGSRRYKSTNKRSVFRFSGPSVLLETRLHLYGLAV